MNHVFLNRRHGLAADMLMKPYDELNIKQFLHIVRIQREADVSSIRLTQGIAKHTNMEKNGRCGK